MFRSFVVRRRQRVVHRVDGAVRAVLGIGRHWVWTWSGLHEFERLTLDVSAALKPLAADDVLPEGVPGHREVVVGPLERIAVLVDGALAGCARAGRYRWWDELGAPDIRRVDLGKVPEAAAADDPLPPTADGWYTTATYAAPVLAVRDGRPASVLPPGRYRVWAGSPWSLRDVPRDLVAIGADVYDPVPVGAHVEVVEADERVAVFVDGAYTRVAQPGRWLRWDAAGKFELRRFSLVARPTPLPDTDLLPTATGCVEVSGTETSAAVLLQDGLPREVLPPGRYRVWPGSRWGLKGVPLSLQSLDVAPQDLLTHDQVPVRLKAAVSVRVGDPLRVLSQPDWPNQVYTAVQLAMREVVTARDLEALLTDRGPAAEELLKRTREVLPDVGMIVETASIKDIILPGEVKDLLNRVTLARKEAEALAIRRREETASTRQLANTARLLENNPVLLRLKELESLGELAARIERITLVGSGDLVQGLLLSNLAPATPATEPGSS